jgi:hypothetical protein
MEAGIPPASPIPLSCHARYCTSVQFLLVTISEYCLSISEREVLCQIFKSLSSNRQNSLSLKYNDDIILLIKNYIISVIDFGE